MRLSLVATLRRHRAILAAISAAVLVAAPAPAQATAQPAKTAAPKASAAPATPAKAPVATAQAAMAVPAKQPPATVAKPATKAVAAAQVPSANRVYVDINHATVKELKNIPGIGDANAAKIIAGRPYANKSQLVSKKIINANLYETIQGMIIAKK
ncbi:MAG: helix-hairpin-helix domain-containing protein [Gemmatimonadaceae bacterium]